MRSWISSALIVLGLAGLFAIVLVSAHGCARAVGNDVHADRIPGPYGFTCLAIYDAEGKAVGGSCLRDEP